MSVEAHGDEVRDLPSPGRAHKVVTEKLIMHIDTAIKGNRHRNIRDVANECNVSIYSVLNCSLINGHCSSRTKFVIFLSNRKPA
ncbi:hypothetical protein TNCV_2313891 [Trichonephila clavipes]|nr:hypothetical protein TNCV_2313891 [Trichonephila clavipes]